MVQDSQRNYLSVYPLRPINGNTPSRDQDQIGLTLEVEGTGPDRSSSRVRRQSRSRERSLHHESVSANGRSFIRGQSHYLGKDYWAGVRVI